MRITNLRRAAGVAFGLAASLASAGAVASADSAAAAAFNDDVPVVRVVAARPALAAELHRALSSYRVPGVSLRVRPPARLDAARTLASR